MHNNFLRYVLQRLSRDTFVCTYDSVDVKKIKERNRNVKNQPTKQPSLYLDLKALE